MLALRDLLESALLSACAGAIAQALGVSFVSVALRCFGATLTGWTVAEVVRDQTGSAGAALVALIVAAVTVDVLLSRVSGEEEDET